jgi:hypothetical protein
MAIVLLLWISPACDVLTSADDWTCEVTVNFGSRTATGTGTGSSQDTALDRAWEDACSRLNLSGSELTRCEDGKNPGIFSSWSARHSCET